MTPTTKNWLRYAAAHPLSVLAVVGTRPECIKLAPVIHVLRRDTGAHVVVVNSGQHSIAVTRSLEEFGLRADVESAQSPPAPSVFVAQQRLRDRLRQVMLRSAARMVLVQGDTLTAYSGARAAFETGIPVAHVEAGLRTNDVREPFPEEWFRRRMTSFVDLHFAPTPRAAENLAAEGVTALKIHVTGNTGIDSLRALLEQPTFAPRRHDPGLVLVTLHRRSNHDRNAGTVCRALIDLCAARPSTRILFPVHPNPRVSTVVRQALGHHSSIELVPPLAYRAFVEWAAAASLIISDSGGLQEEAPYLGTPLLVPRSNTERPEALATGFVELVPVDRGAIVAASLRRLSLPRQSGIPMTCGAPFGAGDAAAIIARVVGRVLREPVAA